MGAVYLLVDREKREVFYLDKAGWAWDDFLRGEPGVPAYQWSRDVLTKAREWAKGRAACEVIHDNSDEWDEWWELAVKSGALDGSE